MREKAEHRGRRGYHPRGDRKSAQTIENRRDSGAPLRKRVRNRMKLQGLQGCDSKQMTYRLARVQVAGLHPTLPGNGDRFQNKGVAGKAIRKNMKTKGREEGSG